MKKNFIWISLTFIAQIVLSVELISCNKEVTTQPSVNSSSVQNSTSGTSLVAWYTFDGDTKDHSGNGNDVVFNSATPTAGKSGLPNTAYSFNGVSSYMKVLNSATVGSFNHGISLVAVLKPTGVYMGPCHGNAVIQKGNSDGVNGSYLIRFDDEKYWNGDGCDKPVKAANENFYASSGNEPYQTLGAISNDNHIKERWYTVVYTSDGTTGSIYVNNVLQGTVTNSSYHFTPNADDLFFGRLNDSQYPYWFNGLIDEIRIYNRALSPSEINQLSK
jgi:hypothetical protein